MITTVTLNPAIDRTLLLDHFEKGEVNRLNQVREDMGGKGINVSRILGVLGEESQAIGFLGKKNLAVVEQLLLEQPFSKNFVIVSEATRTNTKIVELESQTTTDLNEPGFFVEPDKLDEFLALLKKAAGESNYVVFSGSIPRGLPKEIYKTMVSELKGMTKIALDAEGELLLHGLEAGVDIIKPNIHEMEGALGRKLDTVEEMIQASREWISTYGLTYILISMGGNGSVLVGKELAYQAKPIKVKVMSTVGAGDSMLAGFLYGLQQGDVKKALAFGAACGTIAVTREGTCAFSKEEVTEMMSNVEIIEL